MSVSRVLDLVGRKRFVVQVVNKVATHGVVRFNCAEQCLMFCKALRFGDVSMARTIFRHQSPFRQWMSGRSVRGYREDQWVSTRREVALEANRAKFARHVKLRRQLRETGSRALVEVAPKDRVWGIGFDAARAAGREAEWGENLLGVVLMQVREELGREDVEEEDRVERTEAEGRDEQVSALDRTLSPG